ncbi:MAG: S1/P1 nuclease [Bacteroidales bacterium]|nr:S1/P1 nuclease [Bacteroidales bacterium]
MKKILITVLSIAMLFDFTSAFAWGPIGHDVVASIAEQNLTPKAKRKISKILDGKSIVYYSSWMDNIQNSPYWENGYNKTKTWHYANVDKGHTYQTMEKNADGDVVSALEYLTKELTDNYAALTDSMRADYVKMVVHLVGDLHCPMHAGRLSDRGGNGVKVKWFGQNTSLHSVWDSKIVESARKWHYTEWTEQLDRKSRKFKKEAMKGNYEEWFNQTVDNAAAIYDYVEGLNQDNPNLSYQFVYDFSPMLDESLLLGGYRLAHILNTIFG